MKKDKYYVSEYRLKIEGEKGKDRAKWENGKTNRR